MTDPVYSDFSAIMTIIGSVLLYMIVGFLISQLIYSKKIEKRLAANDCYNEAVAGIEQGIYLVGWIVLIPFDLISGFKRFKI